MVIYEIDDDSGRFGYMISTSKYLKLTDKVKVKVDLYKGRDSGAIVFTIINSKEIEFICALNADENYVLMLEDMPASVVCEIFYKFYQRVKE